MNEAMLEAILQALPTQLAVLDQSSMILFVNAAWKSFAQRNGAPWLAEQSIGLNYLSICEQAAGEDAACARQAYQGIAAVLAGTLPLFRLEYPCHSPEERRWFLLYATPLPGQAGQALVIHLNITERKLLEEQVYATNQELSDFLTVVSHELRTPLTSMSGYLQLLQKELHRLQEQVRQGTLLSEALEQYLVTLEQSLKRAKAPEIRLGRLIGDLAEVARIQSGQLKLYEAPWNLVEIVADAVKEQQLAHPSRSIELSLPKFPVIVKVDPDRIGQVITNYLTNALKYAPADRPIKVSVIQEEGELARLSVRDQGPGLLPEEQERIWQRFYRTLDAQRQEGTKGSFGMGLSICRHLIAQHGGQTGVESVPGAGATFWFTLPLQPGSADQEMSR